MTRTDTRLPYTTLFRSIADRRLSDRDDEQPREHRRGGVRKDPAQPLARRRAMLDHRRKGRAVGLETEQPVAQPYRGEADEGRRHRVREKGHRRADRAIGAARQRAQREAQALAPGDREEDDAEPPERGA